MEVKGVSIWMISMAEVIGPVVGSCQQCNEPSGFMGGVEFRYCLNGYLISNT
jgi:hypothetical protein